MRRILLLLPLLATACFAPEPFERDGTWRATGANDANLRAMIADPSHLDRGVAPATPSRGAPASRAIARNAGNSPARLPQRSSSITSNNQGSGAQGLQAPESDVGR